jgi:tRNA pseudouridine38-40 synthase
VPTYRLTIEYDGSHFSGWQVQAKGRTVQGVLLETLRELLGEREIDLQGAGRTDAGVHALAQVASLRCRRTLSTAALLRDLERALPADLAVLGVARAQPRFHARHDATARSYVYQLTTRRSAFGKRVSWWIRAPLVLDRMEVALQLFRGRHDFRAFAKRSAEQESTVVDLERCELATAGEVILVRFVASHFLWNQVRRMVGALVTIGSGEARPTDVATWLRGEATPPPLSAPASGLFLEAVRYADLPFDLPPLAPVGLPAGCAAGRRW